MISSSKRITPKPEGRNQQKFQQPSVTGARTGNYIHDLGKRRTGGGETDPDALCSVLRG